MTGRMVRGKGAPGPWAIALEVKPEQAINMHVKSGLFETVMSNSLSRKIWLQ